MKKYSVKKLVLNGLMIALVFLTTYLTRIPTPLPGGYFNLGDAVIMLTAVILGPISGLAAGAIGSGLADLAAGALLFAPITFVVKGLEGLIVGLIAAKYMQTVKKLDKPESRKTANPSTNLRLAVSLIVGAMIMVAGYFFAEAFLLGMFDEAFGVIAAVEELLPNSIQGGMSAVLGYILIVILSRMDIERYIE